MTARGSRLWRLKYRYGGKEKLLALGSFPEISLKQARERRAEYRSILADGMDPGEERKAQKGAAKEGGQDSFEAVAREWFREFSPEWASAYRDRLIRRLEKDIFPWIGDRPVGEVSSSEILAVVRRIESRGARVTANQAKKNCGQVIRYAMVTGRASADPTVPLKGAITPTRVRHRASITEPKKVGALLRVIDGYEGFESVGFALRLAPLIFVRPGELRGAEWEEIDLEGAVWKIPAERMKMKSPHIVPLSRQAVVVLREFRANAGKGRLVFPGMRSVERPISNNTLSAALRRMGYGKHEMTAHGFRSMASTLLNENGWERDVIERQLAHSERDSVRTAYNHADYLEKRREMMGGHI